ncbi:MAG: hypothetical protein BWY67_01855 [Bacteroidetes bacterium ADurb.Bin397]|nr:MAG: hypothetical protein BWY67_01855 [Bacteroidetes bacterium ADurb.Bin397]
MKLKMEFFLLIFLGMMANGALAQKRGAVWCFGDSAGIDFNLINTPITFASSLVTRGSCGSISNTDGELLFYCSTRSGWPGAYSGFVWNKNHSLMLSGDSIAGDGWYHEMVIIPQVSVDSSYFLFSIGVTMPFGLMYSVIDIRLDGGLGSVVQKNIPLLGGLMVDCVTAIKHGNGRDWWIMVRPSPVGQPVYNNTWLLYLISPSGITAIPQQNIGALNGTNAGQVAVSAGGSKICFTNLGGLIELYDFNRCTGEISNPILIEPQLSVGPFPFYWSAEFSPSGQYLYVSSSTQISRLWQFDLWATNIPLSKTLLWQVQNPANTAGALKRGPDNKIYFACSWSGGGFTFPYDSTEYWPENMNLGVIHFPDSAGSSCNFLPWSFYLGGKRTYKGLPNNPDYDLPTLAGSPCDTLVSQNELAGAAAVGSLHVYYHSAWEKAFINASHLKGKIGNLMVYDLQGKVVHSESLRIQNGYYTSDLSTTGYAKGMYLITIQTEKERLTKKMMVE